MKAKKQETLGIKHRHLDGDIWYCGNPKCACVVRHENSKNGGLTYKYDVCPKCGKEVEYED